MHDGTVTLHMPWQVIVTLKKKKNEPWHARVTVLHDGTVTLPMPWQVMVMDSWDDCSVVILNWSWQEIETDSCDDCGTVTYNGPWQQELHTHVIHMAGNSHRTHVRKWCSHVMFAMTGKQ